MLAVCDSVRVTTTDESGWKMTESCAPCSPLRAPCYWRSAQTAPPTTPRTAPWRRRSHPQLLLLRPLSPLATRRRLPLRLPRCPRMRRPPRITLPAAPPPPTSGACLLRQEVSVVSTLIPHRLRTVRQISPILIITQWFLSSRWPGNKLCLTQAS